MCPRCGKRVYFGKAASGWRACAPGWHGPTVLGLHVGPRRGAGRGFWLRDGIGGTEGCAQGTCKDGSSWRSSWVQGFICVVSPAVTSWVGGVGLTAVLGGLVAVLDQPPSPARQQRGGRDTGGWGPQRCLGSLCAEVTDPLGTCAGGQRDPLSLSPLQPRR